MRLTAKLTTKFQVISFKTLAYFLRVVCGNSHDSVCFKLDKQTWQQKSNGICKLPSKKAFDSCMYVISSAYDNDNDDDNGYDNDNKH